jgi:hypothetical protein
MLGMGTQLQLIDDSVLAVDQTKLQQSEKAGKTALEAIRVATCDETTFADFMKRAHLIVQELEQEREFMVRPLLDGKAEIDKLYKAARTPWEQVKSTCKSKIAESQQARRQHEEEARKQALAAALQEDMEGCSEALSTITPPSPIPASVSWEWVVKETKKQDMPIAFLTPDLVALGHVCKLARNSEHSPTVAGVTFERVARVGVR